VAIINSMDEEIVTLKQSLAISEEQVRNNYEERTTIALY